MYPPPLPQRKTNPQEFIQEIEEDPLAQFTWDFVPAISRVVHKILGLIGQFSTRLRQISPMLTRRQSRETQLHGR